MSILSPVLGMGMTLQSGSQQLVECGWIFVSGPMSGASENIERAVGVGGEKKLTDVIQPGIDGGVLFTPDPMYHTARFFQVTRQRVAPGKFSGSQSRATQIVVMNTDGEGIYLRGVRHHQQLEIATVDRCRLGKRPGLVEWGDVMCGIDVT